MTWSEGEYYDVSFGVNRSRRYHAKMRAFYESLHDLVLATNAVAGTAAFVALIGGKAGLLAQILTGVVAVGSALDTVLGFSKKARLHSDLARRFTELASQMVTRIATDDSFAWAAAERLKIEKDEPPVRRLVDLMAENEEARSRGVLEKDLIRLGHLQRNFGYFFTFGIVSIEREIGKRQISEG